MLGYSPSSAPLLRRTRGRSRRGPSRPHAGAGRGRLAAPACRRRSRPDRALRPSELAAGVADRRPAPHRASALELERCRCRGSCERCARCRCTTAPRSCCSRVVESAAGCYLGPESADLETRADQVTLESLAARSCARAACARVALGHGDATSELARLVAEHDIELLVAGSARASRARRPVLRRDDVEPAAPCAGARADHSHRRSAARVDSGGSLGRSIASGPAGADSSRWSHASPVAALLAARQALRLATLRTSILRCSRRSPTRLPAPAGPVRSSAPAIRLRINRTRSCRARGSLLSGMARTPDACALRPPPMRSSLTERLHHGRLVATVSDVVDAGIDLLPTFAMGVVPVLDGAGPPRRVADGTPAAPRRGIRARQHRGVLLLEPGTRPLLVGRPVPRRVRAVPVSRVERRVRSRFRVACRRTCRTSARARRFGPRGVDVDSGCVLALGDGDGLNLRDARGRFDASGSAPISASPSAEMSAGTSRLVPVTLAGPAGALEALLQVREPPEHDTVAVVCHPHPLYGGTMHNKVVHRVASVMHQLGAAVLRFNFRGVGEEPGPSRPRRGRARGRARRARVGERTTSGAKRWLAGSRSARGSRRGSRRRPRTSISSLPVAPLAPHLELRDDEARDRSQARRAGNRRRRASSSGWSTSSRPGPSPSA